MQSPFRARNWVIFILVNILVSAVTTVLVVRALTQAASRPTTAQTASIAAQAPTDSSALTSPLPATDALLGAQAELSPVPVSGEAQPTDTNASEVIPQPQPQEANAAATDVPKVAEQAEANVRISTVVYPGQRSREAVVIVNEGDQVDMTSWTLSNPRGKIYTFGNVVLFKDSFINLHTTTGVDVPTDLFWNQEEAAWQQGDVATLKRGDEVMATFTMK